MQKPQFRFVIACENEAIGIINYYKLVPFIPNKSLFKCYKNNEENIWLVISGIGNINAAAGVIFLKTNSPENMQNIWINIGIAGHSDAPIGSIHNIKKVINSNNKKEIHYTNSIINDETNILAAYNVDETEREFKEKSFVYEMETVGFMRMVEKFCERELICILKIVSDNKGNKSHNFKLLAKNLIEKNLYKIDNILKKYSMLANEINITDNNLIQLIEEKFHITFYNREKIKRVIPKMKVMMSEKNIVSMVQHSENINDLLEQFENSILNFELKI